MSQPARSEAIDDMLPEYDFSRGVRGKHSRAYRAGTNVIFLDPDVAETFVDSASVNQALRLLVSLARARVPKGRPKKQQLQRTRSAKTRRRGPRR